KKALHLDFSREYRNVQAVEQIRFRDNWSGRVYKRCFWGLVSVGRSEKNPVEEKPPVPWLDTGVYDITASGGMVAWYDWEEDKIFLGSASGEIQESYDIAYHGEKLAFSTDEKYLLLYEKEWGWSGGGTTDDEYCYYRVLDLEEGTWHTIYSGYREWFEVYWEG
ncbi:MAG: hypothetical protein K2O15_00575, partial [Lachnospiraceae bacterium]|nr:hypothetical protein [Lachnospiraceae bacterium]